MKEDISELQSKVKDLEDKINILSKLIEVDLELELDIYRRKQLKPREKILSIILPKQIEEMGDGFE